MSTPSRAARRVLYVAEPAGPWTQHPPAVVDCSVIAALLWAEPAADTAQDRVRGRSLHAPALLCYELANVARNKCRSGVPAVVARAGLETFAEQRIELHEIDVGLLFETAARYAITAYDAAYLALAMALQAPLLTFDHKLADAAARVRGAPE